MDPCYCTNCLTARGLPIDYHDVPSVRKLSLASFTGIVDHKRVNLADVDAKIVRLLIEAGVVKDMDEFLANRAEELFLLPHSANSLYLLVVLYDEDAHALKRCQRAIEAAIPKCGHSAFAYDGLHTVVANHTYAWLHLALTQPCPCH